MGEYARIFPAELKAERYAMRKRQCREENTYKIGRFT
jgi:hypothetical protein